MTVAKATGPTSNRIAEPASPGQQGAVTPDRQGPEPRLRGPRLQGTERPRKQVSTKAVPAGRPSCLAAPSRYATSRDVTPPVPEGIGSDTHQKWSVSGDGGGSLGRHVRHQSYLGGIRRLFSHRTQPGRMRHAVVASPIPFGHRRTARQWPGIGRAAVGQGDWNCLGSWEVEPLPAGSVGGHGRTRWPGMASRHFGTGQLDSQELSRRHTSHGVYVMRDVIPAMREE